MTKREMVEEMIEGLKFSNNEKIIENRCKQSYKRVKEMYEYYLKSEKTDEDKLFCINLLIKWYE